MARRMDLFHVYVEAPDRSPETVQHLAEAISQRYGVPAADLATRLAAGRFRVKANVDRATAETYAAALAESGAIVKIEDAVPTQPVPIVAPPAPESVAPGARAPKPSGAYAVVKRPSQPSVPPVNEPAPRPSHSALPPRESRTSTPPAGVPRPTSSSLPPPNRPAPQMASGLSAAFTESAQPTDLGALSSDALSLSSLDGKETGSQTAITEDIAPPSVSFAPPAQGAAKPAKPRPKDEPVDLFAPPDADEAKLQVELATDEIEHRQARAAAAAAASAAEAATPPAGTPIAAPVTTPQLSSAKKKLTPVPGVPVTVAAEAQETPRARFAAGVIVAILVGFVPAHFIAASREASAFDAVDKAVIETQAGAVDPDSYARLDEFRDKQLSYKESRKFSIAWQSMLIWAVVGGAVAYAWFYRVPWDKLGKKPA